MADNIDADGSGAAALEQTLYVCRDNVKVFSIPATKSSDGRVLSAEWRVDACCFTGRLRLLARGDHAEIRLEDANSGDLFAVAPIAPGTRAQVVEPVADSSRNFVLRLADAATGRHAFVGLGFAERPEAFDFNVALGDHDKHVRRAREIEEAKRQSVAASRADASAASACVPAAAAPSTSRRGDPDDPGRSVVSALYGAAGRDLSLKEGETIKVAVVRSGGGGAGGAAAKTGAAAGEAAPGSFLARQQASSSSSGAGGLFSLPPPPGTTAGAGLAPPPPAAVPPPASGNDSGGGGGDPFAPLAPSNGDSASASASAPAAAEDQGWATFD